MTPTLFSIAMKLFQNLVCAAAIGLCLLCETTTLTLSGTNVVQRTTELQIRAVFDSKNSVGKVRASNGATQVVGASDITEEATSAGLNNLLGTVVKAAVQGAK